MGFLEDCDTKQAKKIRKLNPKKGQWAQRSSEFGDVWHEIESVYLSAKDKFFSKDWSSLRLYCHRRNERPIESEYFHNIRKVVNKLPKNACVVMCKEGLFSDRQQNWDKLPERVWK